MSLNSVLFCTSSTTVTHGHLLFFKKTLPDTMETLNTFFSLHSLSLALIHRPIAD